MSRKKKQKSCCKWVPQKIRHMLIHWLYWLLIHAHILHDVEVKDPISGIKKVELSVKFKLFQCCHDLFTVLCLSLDWKINFNLDFLFVLFLFFVVFWNHLGVATKMFGVFCWKLYKMIPQNCRRKELGDEVTATGLKHRTHNRILNHLGKLTKWLSWVVSIYLYGTFDCMFLSCHIRVSEWIHTL